MDILEAVDMVEEMEEESDVSKEDIVSAAGCGWVNDTFKI